MKTDLFQSCGHCWEWYLVNSKLNEQSATPFHQVAFTQEYKIGLSFKKSVRIILHSNRIITKPYDYVVVQSLSCVWLCNPMNCSMPGFPVLLSLLRLMCTESMMASLMAQMINNLPTMQETRFSPWVGKISWGREQLHLPVFLPGELHEQRSLVGYSALGCKESKMTEWLTLSLSLWLCKFIKKHLTKFNSYSQ